MCVTDMHKLRGLRKYPFWALKYFSSLMFFWPSVKGHSHITGEMPQILASGFVSLYFFGTVTTVGLSLIFFTVQSTQAFYRSGKGQSWGQKQYVSALCSVAGSNWRACCFTGSLEPKSKQTIPHEYKFCIKLDTYTCTYKYGCIYSKLNIVNALLFWTCWIFVTIFKLFQRYIVSGASSGFSAA